MTFKKSAFCTFLFFTPVLLNAGLSRAQLDIMQHQELSFGTMVFVNANSVAQVDVDTNDGYASSNVVFDVTPTTGDYTLTGGTSGEVWTIVPDVSVNLNGAGPSNLILDNIAVDPSTGTFDINGESPISVGGRLRTDGNASPSNYANGTYTNNITLIVSY